MTQVKRRGRPPTHSREDMLSVCRSVAAERGWDALRFADVAAASGVPVSSLQHHFGTRDAMVREAVAAGVREELQRVASAASGIADPWLRLRRMLRMVIASDDSDRREGWRLWVEHWHSALRDGSLLADTEAIQDEWLDLFAAVVRDGRRSGAFRPVAADRDVAVELLALVDGLGIPLLLHRRSLSTAKAQRLVTLAAQRLVRPVAGVA